MERDLLRERLRERDPLLPNQLLDVMGDVEDAVRRVPAPRLVVPRERAVELGARGDEDLRAGLLDRPDVVRHQLLLGDLLVAHPRDRRAGAPLLRPEDLVRHPGGVQDLHDGPGDLLFLVARHAAHPVHDFGRLGLDGFRWDPRGPPVGGLAE